MGATRKSSDPAVRVPSALSLATLRAGQILDWSNADKVALIVLCPAPLVAVTYARVHQHLIDRALEPTLDHGWFAWLELVIVVWLVSYAAFVPAWLVVRRMRPESRGFALVVLTFVLVMLSFGGFLVGSVTTPLLGALLAALCAILLLFDPGLSVGVAIAGVVAYFAPLVAVFAGWVRYAPVFRPSEFSQSEIGREWLASTSIVAIGLTIVPTVLLASIVRRWRSRDATLLELARLDPLTHVANRRYFFDRLQIELERGRRHESTLAVMLLDIDYFKKVNDEYGHLAGDGVLVHLSEVLRMDVLRRIDLVGRYGGEEFAVLLPETDLAGALAVAERCRTTIALRPCPRADGEAIAITVSIGVVVPKADEGADAVVRRVDEALYRAKEAGRDRVIASE